jgi:hypothetical protein
LAFDVAIGVCRIKSDDMVALRALADWRYLKDVPKRNSNAQFYEYFLNGQFRNRPVIDWATKTEEGSMPSRIIDKREIFSK